MKSSNTQQSDTRDAMDSDDPKEAKLSGIVEEIFDSNRGPSTFGNVAMMLNHHGMAAVLILFSLPSALPVPAPGYSTILSIPLLITGIRIILGYRTMWLPERVKKKSFNPQSFAKASSHIVNTVKFIERFSKPRLVWLVRSRLSHMFIGTLICALGISMVLPIPGTNTLPAGGIFLIGFSLLEDDGLLLFAGILYSIAALCLALAVIFIGVEVLDWLKTFIYSLM